MRWSVPIEPGKVGALADFHKYIVNHTNIRKKVGGEVRENDDPQNQIEEASRAAAVG